MRKELYIYLNLTSEDYLTTEDIQNIQTKIEEIIDIKPTIEFSNSIIRKNI
jgi:hypothetical protein